MTPTSQSWTGGRRAVRHFAQPESDRFEISELVANPRVGKVAVYTWNLHAELIEQARAQGAAGYLSKALPARDLVAAIEAVHAGEKVFNEPAGRVRAVSGSDWPGRSEGLTDRESEVLALITQGMSNAEVADLTYLSPNTIKTYIRSVYRKIGAGPSLWTTAPARSPSIATPTRSPGGIGRRVGKGRRPS